MRMRERYRKGQVLGQLGTTFQQLAFLGIFGAIMIIVLVGVSNTQSPVTNTVNNESATKTAGGTTDLGGSFILDQRTRVVTSGVIIHNFTNFTIESNNFDVFENGSVIFGAGADITDGDTTLNVTYSFQTDSTAQQAIGNTTTSIGNVFEQLPLFGTILGLLLIVGVVFLLVRRRDGTEGSL